MDPNTATISPSPLQRPRRIVVVGTTGSGKTTLAGELARRLALPHVELDALHWEPNWTEAPLERFRQRTDEAIRGDGWVVDGNYSKVRDLVWGRAELLVWLDFPLPVIMGRLVRRIVRRVITQEELWNGNRERLRDHLFTRDSLLLWALQSYRRKRRTYPPLFTQPEYRHLAVVRFRSPRAAKEWLTRFTREACRLE
jgi:adenylate kinase family enzyme